MKISIPKTCPCCDFPLELVNDQLFCRNTGCSAQLFKKLEHWCKVLGIKGMGPKTVEKLDLSDITELYYLDPEQITQSLGSVKIAQKLSEEIDRSRGADLATVLWAFSIPLIGNTASTKIANVVDHIDQITVEKCKEAGLGEKATINLMTWLLTEFKELREFLPFSFRSQKEIVSNTIGPTVCITGKLTTYRTKGEAGEHLTSLGYRVVDSVTKTLDYLVDESGDGSTKRKKADQYGIKIITNLNQFLKETQ